MDGRTDDMCEHSMPVGRPSGSKKPSDDFFQFFPLLPSPRKKYWTSVDDINYALFSSSPPPLLFSFFFFVFYPTNFYVVLFSFLFFIFYPTNFCVVVLFSLFFIFYPTNFLYCSFVFFLLLYFLPYQLLC